VKFLFDQDVPENLIFLLQALGHEVLRLRDVLSQEAADDIALAEHEPPRGPQDPQRRYFVSS
jgi:hypothetical protein